jgi:hypothetical protein
MEALAKKLNSSKNPKSAIRNGGPMLFPGNPAKGGTSGPGKA